MMALTTVVKRSQLHFADRLDAEHYSPRFTPTLETLRNNPTVKLRRIITEPVKTGHTPSTKVAAYYGGGIKFIKTDNVREDRIEAHDLQMLTELGNSHIPNSELRVDDVVVTIIGATEEIVGRAARVSEEILRANINQNIALIRPAIPSGYFTIFLNTRYGREQLIWLSRQTGQVNLNCREVEEISIPQFSNDFVNKIHSINTRRQDLLRESIETYAKANELLLSDLNLSNWMPPNKPTYIRKFSEVSKARRIDAEHFQPKYDVLFESLNKEAKYLKPVKEFRSFNARGKQPVYSKEGRLRQINSRHILEQHLDYEGLEHTSTENWDTQKEARVFSNDILTYTTGANVGRTNVYLDAEQALASNHVNILRLREENPIYVGFVINSIIGRLQTRKWITGTAQPELYPSDIDRFLIPFISHEQQELISSMVVQSNLMRQKAATLLKKAKQAVERAIEDNEIQALRSLDTLGDWAEGGLS